MKPATTALRQPQWMPAYSGASLKREHARDILESNPDIGWFEVHAENYMGAGGPPHHLLTAIRDRYCLSIHGVALSIGSAKALDLDHLARLRRLIDRYEPELFSEHLAWSSHDDIYLNDLLPVPYTSEALDRVCDHIDMVQETLGRQMLLENPSTYVTFDSSTMSETAFLNAVAKRTGCGLLLDSNNVVVSATNHGLDVNGYLRDLHLDVVQEIHMAGHSIDTDDAGRPLLVDSHDRPVGDAVKALLPRVMAHTGPLPTIVEWDSDIPDWAALYAEAKAVEKLIYGGIHAVAE